jgi:hypothetical protein
MMIDRNNYEAFFLDYWENTLNPETRQQLSLFLEANPDLQNEFLDFRDIVSLRLNTAEHIEYPDKSSLKKHVCYATPNIDEKNYEDKIIAFLEGDLTGDEQLEFDEFVLKNPHLVTVINLYKKTFLQPDDRIVFRNKQALKRNFISPVFRNFFVYGSAVAAVLLLAFVLLYPFGNGEPGDDAAMVAGAGTEPVEHLPVLQSMQDMQFAGFEQIDPADSPAMEKRTFATLNLVEETGGDVSGLSNQPRVAYGLNDGMSRTTSEQIEFLDPNFNFTLMASASDPGRLAGRRAEVSDVFNDMILRDALSKNKTGSTNKNAFGRVLANIGDKIFGNPAGAEAETSFFGQIAGLSKEKILDIAERSPKFETIEQDGSKKTYLALNDNLSIRVSTVGKTARPKE